MVLSKQAILRSSNALPVQSVKQVHLLFNGDAPHATPICCVDEDAVLFMSDVLLFISEVVLLFMFISEVVLFMFISEVVLFMFISEVVYSQVVSGSSVTVVIDRSRSEGEEVVYINRRCSV